MHAAATVPPSLLQLLLERYGPGIDESFLHLVAALHDINVVGGKKSDTYGWGKVAMSRATICPTGPRSTRTPPAAPMSDSSLDRS